MKCKNCGKTKEEHFKRNVRYRERVSYWRGIENDNTIMGTFVEEKLFCTKYGKRKFALDKDEELRE